MPTHLTDNLRKTPILSNVPMVIYDIFINQRTSVVSHMNRYVSIIEDRVARSHSLALRSFAAKSHRSCGGKPAKTISLPILVSQDIK